MQNGEDWNEETIGRFSMYEKEYEHEDTQYFISNLKHFQCHDHTVKSLHRIFCPCGRPCVSQDIVDVAGELSKKHKQHIKEEALSIAKNKTARRKSRNNASDKSKNSSSSNNSNQSETARNKENYNNAANGANSESDAVESDGTGNGANAANGSNASETENMDNMEQMDGPDEDIEFKISNTIKENKLYCNMRGCWKRIKSNVVFRCADGVKCNNMFRNFEQDTFEICETCFATKLSKRRPNLRCTCGAKLVAGTIKNVKSVLNKIAKRRNNDNNNNNNKNNRRRKAGKLREFKKVKLSSLMDENEGESSDYTESSSYALESSGYVSSASRSASLGPSRTGSKMNAISKRNLKTIKENGSNHIKVKFGFVKLLFVCFAGSTQMFFFCFCFF